MDLSILNDKEGFRKAVIDTLAQAPVDFHEEMQFIEAHRGSQTPFEAGGVLLPLFFQEDQKQNGGRSGQYVFLLSKRSKKVLQAGDLCAPGGGIHPFLDSLSKALLQAGLLSLGRVPALKLAKERGKQPYQRILFFLGNALRESWEEIRLSPFNVEYMGILPVYRLHSRRWIIFPVVGRVKKAWQPKLSWEVEKIVAIPLKFFFQPENYALYSLEVPEKLIDQGIPNPWEFPCLVYEDQGEEEILWGATFNIIQSFLQIIFPNFLPSPDGQRVIHRPLVSNYFSGNQEP